ncbi:helix-turn-helix domain-containing protein [Streptomyces sp. NPDC101118]|uniref:helix-turn-helix domain-containing protein n=1 Tax=Streptomyces sp. NPDC101118 TaxID=3366109 RepID=UPI00380EF4F3
MATARQLRLARELRTLRERAGLNATQAAQHLGIRQTQISNMEAARIGVSPERVRALAALYECPDEAYVQALARMTERRRGWWEEYRGVLPDGLLDLAELEHHGTGLRTAHTSHIPGLLQTVEHAREIYRQAIPELSPPAIEHRISHRIKRQAVLHGPDPVRYRAIVHEAALRMRFGGLPVVRGQLDHLLKMSELTHIELRVIPFSAGSYPGSGQTINYVSGPVPQLDTVQLDQSHGVVFLGEEERLTQYRLLFERLEGLALQRAESAEFIRQIAASL